LINKFYFGYQIKKNEMGGTCGTYGGEDRWVQGFVGKPEGKRPLGRPRVDGRPGLVWLRIRTGGGLL
jgi:hypothetical protein